MQRVLLVASGLAGFGSLVMGVVAAHGAGAALGPAARGILETGIRAQGLHAAVLLAVALGLPRLGRFGIAAGVLLIVGMLLFCGALYGLALAGVSLGPAAPAGGLCLMAGWLALAAAGFSR
jgi:uncharacterized membrane protein YgdD (TMEM256/DUF423 family)